MSRPNHFAEMALFAFFVSLAFACLSHRGLSQRLKYVAWSFLAFLLTAILLGWLMYPFSR